MRATCFDSRNPMFFQLLPPSVDLYTPSPQLELCRLLFSPVPTQTRFGSSAGIVTAPIDALPAESKTGVRETPLLVVFQRPPVAVAM